MKDSFERLTRKQAAALAALLSAPTHRQAPQACGVSEVTLWRWLKQDEFRAAYLAARQEAFEQACGRLQAALGAAVETLERQLTCGQAAVEARAAAALLSHGLKVTEMFDIIRRIEALHRRVDEHAGRR
jgi:hypothetical protein